jgi:hypothetical protein
VMSQASLFAGFPSTNIFICIRAPVDCQGDLHLI